MELFLECRQDLEGNHGVEGELQGHDHVDDNGRPLMEVMKEDQ